MTTYNILAAADTLVPEYGDCAVLRGKRRLHASMFADNRQGHPSSLRYVELCNNATHMQHVCKGARLSAAPTPA